MGDLTSNTPSLTFNSPTAGAQTITLSKTWDNESLQLQFGGGCGGVITVSKGPVTTPDSIGTNPATAKLSIAPASAGSCTLLVGDQYGEPPVSIPINVKSAPLNTLGAVEFGQLLAYNAMGPQDHIAQWINSVLAGGIALADASMCMQPPYARLWLQGGAIDANGADGFNSTDAHGCVTNADGTVHLWATEAGYTGQFTAYQNCLAYISISSSAWSVGSYVNITPVAQTSSCVFPVASSDHTTANGTAKNVTAIVDDPICQSPLWTTPQRQSCNQPVGLNGYSDSSDGDCNDGGAGITETKYYLDWGGQRLDIGGAANVAGTTLTSTVGTLTINADGSVTFTRAAGATGEVDGIVTQQIRYGTPGKTGSGITGCTWSSGGTTTVQKFSFD